MLDDSTHHKTHAIDDITEHQNAHWPRDSVLLKGRDRNSAASNNNHKLPSYETLMQE